MLRWLHLTDLHFGKNDESQKIAIASLVEAILRVADGRSFDLVLLTGDIAFSGAREQYAAFISELVEPLRASHLFAGAKFIAAPGNHDLDCDVEIPPSWKEMGRTRQEKFFHTTDEGRRVRGSRANAFAEYSNCCSANRIESVDPTREPAKLIKFLSGEKAVAVVSVVTAFFSDKETNDKQKAPAPLHAIRAVTLGLPAETVLLVAGHHPPEWFISESEDHLHSYLLERNALYLHGHLHRMKSKFGSRGLASLGFGAGYQDASDSPPKPLYRNSFAICEMTDALDVQVVSWDAEHGQWRPDQNLPGDFRERSVRLPDGFRLPIAATKLSDYARTAKSVGAAVREDVSVDRCLWLASHSPKRWMQLLQAVGAIDQATEVYALPAHALATGHLEFRTRDGDEQLMVHAVSAHGDVLSYDALQKINTELDTQAFERCVVATLGELSSDARILANQLSQRKAITIFERKDIVRRVLRNLPASLETALFAAAEANLLVACLIVTETGFALLVEEITSNSWFHVVDETGAILPESSQIVGRIRKEFPRLEKKGYSQGKQIPKLAHVPVIDAHFDRSAYLSQCKNHFDNVKYAPLVALGLRFKKASLTDIYVQASADVGGATKTSHNLTRVVTEFVESLNLPKSQRDQLEGQLRSRYGLNRSAEVGAARKLYQRYNNVVVLGDPGSGKTCFVQYEILAYCSHGPDQSSWYARHLPVYVPLAEAARLLDGSNSMLDICEIVASRRGLELPKEAIEQAIADGQAAFFFDGLDEVGYIDKRIALLQEISNLVKSYAPRGTRFVLTSRPAAVQPVDIPEGLTYLQLRGLTEDEIRILAGRVLTTRLSGTEESLTGEEESIITRLLEDSRNEPGIARIARNPLLLTLLVLIYANSGAISARRHLIYTQAIKTLVSVRGRQTREQNISEADLRKRLGAFALAVFEREIPEIPRRADVVGVLSPLMHAPSHATKGVSLADIANSFIQEVAEATGLLTIHAREDAEHEELVTFMHYSFLEYYVAAGLLTTDYLRTVPRIASNARWRDVITLLFGMLSEQGDVTPLLDQLLSANPREEGVSGYRMLLALDCANECDVPPEASQSRLAGAMYEAISAGAGRFSSDFRSDIGARIGFLLQGMKPPAEHAILQGLAHADPVVAAAFADVISRIDKEVELNADIRSSFDSFLQRDHAVVRAAAMAAIERRPELRSEQARTLVKRCLRGSIVEQYAAIKVIAAVPEFGESLRSNLVKLLDEPSTLVSSSAAQCLLVDALKGGVSDEKREAFIENLLTKVSYETNERVGLFVRGVTLDIPITQNLIFSGSTRESELAIRHLALVRDNHQFVYETLTRRLKSTEEPRIQAACLDSLRASGRAIDLITIADTDTLCALLNSKSRNVRIAAAKVLGELPDDEQVISSLQKYLEEAGSSESRSDELAAAAGALAKHVRRNQKLRAATLSSLVDFLPRDAAEGFGDTTRQQHTLALLNLCESVGGTVPEGVAWSLARLADDYRTPVEMRRSLLRVFGSIVEPSEKSARYFVDTIANDDLRLNDARYAAVEGFVRQCKRKVEFVRRVYPHLAQLSSILRDAWYREAKRSSESIDPHALRDVRSCVVEVDALIVSYDEFSGRARVQ